MNNKSLSLSISLSLQSNASLTLLPINPPSFTHSHSLHLLREHEPAAFSASPSVFELFWHMRFLSASLTLFPPLRPSIPLQCTSSAHPGQEGERRQRLGTPAKKAGRNNRNRKWAVTCVRGDCGQIVSGWRLFWTLDEKRTSREEKEKDWLKSLHPCLKKLNWLFYLFLFFC